MDQTTEIKELTIVAPNIPIPACIVNEEGKIESANHHIEKVFPFGDVEEQDFFALSGVKLKTLRALAEANVDEDGPANGQENDQAKERDKTSAQEEPSEELILERNSRKFSLTAEALENGNILVFFYDVTSYEEIKNRYDREQICVCRINVDNYDQFTNAVSSETGMTVSTELNKTIRRWSSEIGGAIDKIKETQYVIHFQKSKLDELALGKFQILDEVRAIETGIDFPLSLSIGIGAEGKDISETAEFAAAALDLALGRGGDQAVIKNQNRIQYYGGKTQSVEKSNKGKSRIVGHAIKKLIEQSNRVFIMGHQHADMDAFGSAMGIYRICLTCGTEAFIVIDEIPENIRAFQEQVRAAENYNIIGTEQARSMIEKDTLIVVLDTHRPSYIEAPDLLEMTDQIVVIDHHRRVEDSIENPTLAYIETYASSTSELVTEMLQYVLNRKTLVRLEAEALLAGMTIDTNRFAVKTGARTFEAAAWLRRSGADTAEIKKYFQMDKESFHARAAALANAKIHEGGIATAITEGGGADVQVINAQVADGLLNIKGIKASIVAGINHKGITCVSARSLGDMNVQLLLEKFGGGGHLTVAGAQVEESPEEVLEKILREAEEMGRE
ncbi:MAG: DHH family phosphoesterase [Firmicutes bacterium]|nr:DHH family phosphoesterase [Bacillota bacterium]